jgi:DNA-binding MarR family transcriptional regulator
MEETQTKIMSGMIPASVLSDKSLSQTSKLLYGIIHGFNFNGKQCFATNKTIGEAIGVDARSVSRAVSDLVAAKLITSTEVKEQRILTVVTLLMKPSAIDKNVVPHDKDVSTPTTRMSYPHDKDVVHNNNLNNNINNKFFLEEEKKQEKKVVEEVKRDPKVQEVLDKALKPLDASIEQDNRWVLLSRRPMVKYPLMWLSERDLEQAIETCQAKGISLKAVLDITQSWCEQQLLEGKPEKYINAVSAIQGWAMERVLSIELAEVKIENQVNFMKGKGK